MRNQRNFLSERFEAELALERLVSLVFHLLVPDQRCVVREGNVALLASITVLVLEVVVHRKLAFARKSFVADFADVLAGLFDDLQMIVINFASSRERCVGVRAKSVFFVRAQFGVKGKAVEAIWTLNRSWHVVKTVQMRVESFLSGVFVVGTFIT